jgi:hypothetical protein
MVHREATGKHKQRKRGHCDVHDDQDFHDGTWSTHVVSHLIG